MSVFSRRRPEREPPAQPPPTLPVQGAWVHLFADDDEPVVARVERSAERQVDVAVDSPGQTVATGHVLVQWPSGQGLWLLETEAEPLSPGRWRLTATGATEEIQRRSFVRVPASVRVMLRTATRGIIRATSADLSETGVSVLVPGDAEVEVGQRLQVSLMLHNTPVTMHGEVVRAQQTSLGQLELGVHFTPPYADDVIRRWVLAAQLNERARRRGG